MALYAFTQYNSSILGVGGAFAIGNGAAVAEEGISIENVADQNIMTKGLDDSTMHSYVANNGATLTLRLLKTAITNQLLQNMWNAQKTTLVGIGANVITGVGILSGDLIVLNQVAFKKQTPLTFAKEGGMNEWIFDCGQAIYYLGGNA